MFSTARPTMTPSYTATGHYASGLRRLCRCKGSRVSRKFSHLSPTRSVCTSQTPPSSFARGTIGARGSTFRRTYSTIAPPKVTAHEIPKKVHVHVIHLRNTLPHKLTPDVLTEVRALCESLNSIEEIMAVKTDGNHNPPPSCSAFNSSSMSCDTERRC